MLKRFTRHNGTVSKFCTRHFAAPKAQRPYQDEWNNVQIAVKHQRVNTTYRINGWHRGRNGVDVHFKDTPILKNKWVVLWFTSWDDCFGAYGPKNKKEVREHFEQRVREEFEPLGCEVILPYVSSGTWHETYKNMVHLDGFQLGCCYIIDPAYVCRWLTFNERPTHKGAMDTVLAALKEAQADVNYKDEAWN